MYSFSCQEGVFVISECLTHKFHSSEPGVFFTFRKKNGFGLNVMF